MINSRDVDMAIRGWYPPMFKRRGVTLGTDIHAFTEIKVNERKLLRGDPDEVKLLERRALGGDPEAQARLDLIAPLEVWRPLELFPDEVKSRIRIYEEDRNYSLFGLLAGVRRTDCGVIDEPRGLPRDVTDWVGSKFVEGDDHSASWVTIDELMMELEGFRNDGHWLKDANLFDHAEDVFKVFGAERARLVFWFDS